MFRLEPIQVRALTQKLKPASKFQSMKAESRLTEKYTDQL